MNDYDVIVVGGGMVGASFASALSSLPLSIAIVEAHPPEAPGQPSYDDRSTALSIGSRRILESIGLWSLMHDDSTPILSIHVSDRGRPGFARIDHREEGVDALGHVVVNRRLGAALTGFIDRCDNVALFAPARVAEMENQGDVIELLLSGSADNEIRRIRAPLLVAADGVRSQIREWAGIQVTEWDYGQTAIVTNVTPQRPHRGTAFERFTDDGALAVLPLGTDRCGIVWTGPHAPSEERLALDDPAFVDALQSTFGYRLGNFTRVGKRLSYPLQLVRADEQIRPRVVILGNAAHGLHPIAGQGFNLALRDAATLAEVIADAMQEGQDFGTLDVLSRYARWRASDQRRTVAFTDGLIRTFTNPLFPVRVLRNAGMLALDLVPGAKRVFARYTMGMAGRLPRLARGVPLI